MIAKLTLILLMTLSLGMVIANHGKKKNLKTVGVLL